MRTLRKLKRTIVTPPVDLRLPELEAILERLSIIKKQIAALELEHELRQQNVIEILARNKLDSYDKGPVQGTVVGGDTESMDWDGLRRKLPAAKWKQILGEPQPERAKLEALIELGAIDAAIVAEFLTVKPKKKFVRLTDRTAA